MMKQQLETVQTRIHQACQRSGRSEKDVQMLLATKTVSPDRLLEAHQLGPALFGENKAQELLSKLEPLQHSDIEWHFIGHLQSNKAKEVVPHCRLIHSLDRWSLAKELEKQAQKHQKTQSVLIEVNTSGEESKSGLPPAELIEFCEKVKELKHLQVEGLMTMAMASEEEQPVKACFSQLRQLLQKINASAVFPHELKELSMGMSGDFEWAIEEGATIIRLGSVIFGSRQ